MQAGMYKNDADLFTFRSSACCIKKLCKNLISKFARNFLQNSFKTLLISLYLFLQINYLIPEVFCLFLWSIAPSYYLSKEIKNLAHTGIAN